MKFCFQMSSTVIITYLLDLSLNMSKEISLTSFIAELNRDTSDTACLFLFGLTTYEYVTHTERCKVRNE